MPVVLVSCRHRLPSSGNAASGRRRPGQGRDEDGRAQEQGLSGGGPCDAPPRSACRRRSCDAIRGADACGSTQVRRPVDVDHRAARHRRLRARRGRGRRRQRPRAWRRGRAGSRRAVASARSPASASAAMSVSVSPGATAVTAMPRGPSARASDWPNAISPALLAPYAGWPGSPRNAPREETLTIRPPSRMWRTAHQVTLAAPTRLTAERALPRPLPLVVARLGDRVRLEDARVVDERRRGRRAPRRRASTMARTASASARSAPTTTWPSPGSDPRPARRARRPARVVHRHPVAARGERVRDRRADTARGAGHEHAEPMRPLGGGSRTRRHAWLPP